MIPKRAGAVQEFATNVVLNLYEQQNKKEIKIMIVSWYLAVVLQSPLDPTAATQWNMTYGPYTTPEPCEQYAVNVWRKYNERYNGTMTPWTQTFTTTCSSSTHHHEYKWFIQCDQFNNCNTRKYKGDRR
jgi:hypothetical protein